MTTRTPAPVAVDTGAAAPVALDRAPAPVPVPVDTVPVISSPPERAPAPVNTILDPELPRPPVPVLRPSATQAAPAPDPYPEEPVAAVIPVEEQPVPDIPVIEPDANIAADTSRYITVSEDGAVVLINASTLNFVGSAVEVTGNDSVATITVTSAAEYGNANVVSLLAGFGSNSVSTTGNVIAGRFTGNGRGLTDIAWSNVTGAPAFVTLANFSVSTNTASGNGSLSYDNTTGVFSFTPADASLSQYGNANVVSLLAGFGSNNVSTTGNVTAGVITADYFVGNGLYGNQTDDTAVLGNASGDVQVYAQDTAVGIQTYTGLVYNTWLFDSDGVLSAAGNITADFFIGSGSALTDLPYGNVIENGNSNVTINVPNGDVVISVGTKTWTFEVNGNTTIPGNILGVDGLTLDNRFAEVQTDIQLFSADDILLQGRDRPVGSDLQGGDINIYAGDSGDDHGVFAPSSGGDVEIEGGRGGTGNVNPGGEGGYISIRAGHGGNANVGGGGGSAGSGANITLTAGNAGTNSGNIELGNVGGQVLVSAGNSSGNGSVGGSVLITTGTGGPNASSGEVQINVPLSDAGPGGTWSFDYAGNLTLPSEGNVIGITAANPGRMQWKGNSSGDGNGYTTLELVPDATVTGTDQYVIIDPTAPGHIHIRAGGTQDNSSADLILGGEISNVRVTAGENPPVYVSANSRSWIFGVDGVLQAPGDISTSGNVTATRLKSDANLVIQSNVAGTARTWTFDTLGDLNLPVGGNITGSGGISANNITLTGNISANVAGFAIGYRDIPQVSFTGNATIAAADAGRHFYSTESTDYILTIADNSAVPWPVGTAVTVVNRGTGNITVAQASGVSLYLAGNSTAGNRTVSTYGMATVLNVAANVWMINGTGVA